MDKETFERKLEREIQANADKKKQGQSNNIQKGPNIEMENLNIPNMDSLEQDELRELSKVFMLLNAYAQYKQHAIGCRLAGNISLALHFERIADIAYEKLPIWARW